VRTDAQKQSKQRAECGPSCSRALACCSEQVRVSRLPFGSLEAEVSIAEKTMVTMEQ
jgi:hypothetical protein